MPKNDILLKHNPKPVLSNQHQTIFCFISIWTSTGYSDVLKSGRKTNDQQFTEEKEEPWDSSSQIRLQVTGASPG